MAKKKTHTLTYAQAIAEGHVQTLERDPGALILGLGVTDYKGIFGTTLAARRKFGRERVIETPASENALTGVCIGAAVMGKRPVFVHARNDFMFLALDQMLNAAAKWKYMYAGKSTAPIVVRGIIGKGWGQGPTHSQSVQSVFAHFPGLNVAMPATPADAKGLLVRSMEIDSPTVIIEHRRLYDTAGPVPVEPKATPFGRARVARRGEDVTIVATSIMVSEAVKAHMALKKMGVSAEVIDPRTLRPLDDAAIVRSVRKTGRLVVADTSWIPYGVSAEIVARVAEKAHDALQAPVRRIGMAECPAPVSLKLEERFYPTYKDLFLACCDLVGRKPDRSLISDPLIDEFKGPY